MSCDRCQELSVDYRIASPSDLRSAIRIVGESVADGTLREIHGDSVPYSQAPFGDLVNGANWDDLVTYAFECCQCGQVFHLDAETYHGSGGFWRPAARGAVSSL